MNPITTLLMITIIALMLSGCESPANEPCAVDYTYIESSYDSTYVYTQNDCNDLQEIQFSKEFSDIEYARVGTTLVNYREGTIIGVGFAYERISDSCYDMWNYSIYKGTVCESFDEYQDIIGHYEYEVTQAKFEETM